MNKNLYLIESTIMYGKHNFILFLLKIIMEHPLKNLEKWVKFLIGMVSIGNNSTLRNKIEKVYHLPIGKIFVKS